MAQVLARDQRQLIFRHGFWGKPADLRAFPRFENGGRAGDNATDERGRHPMLAFGGQDVIYHVEQLSHGDLYAVFLTHLTFEGVDQAFTKLHRAAGEFP